MASLDAEAYKDMVIDFNRQRVMTPVSSSALALRNSWCSTETWLTLYEEDHGIKLNPIQSSYR